MPTNPYLRPMYPASHSLSGGIRKPGSLGRIPTELITDEILCIEELLDVPIFIPQCGKKVMKDDPMFAPSKHNWTHAQGSNINTPFKTMGGTAATSDEMVKSNIKQLAGTYDSNKTTPSLASRTAGSNADDIMSLLKSGAVKWEQMTFNKAAFEYLKKNINKMK